jgi:hypothetical protein
MTANFDHSAINLTAVTSVCAEPVANNDELGFARQRMRHLNNWNVKVLPSMHSASATLLAEPLSEEARERYHHLALKILAVHMQNAAVSGALQ